MAWDEGLDKNGVAVKIASATLLGGEVYGAIFVDAENVQSLHQGIQKIRDDCGYGHLDSLKFSGRPKDVSYEEHREAKRKIVKLARNHYVCFCTYAILHAIAKGQRHNNGVLFGANTLLLKFNEFLEHQRDVGIVVFDRIPVSNQFKYLKDKFQIGGQYSNGTRRLENIVGYTTSCDGASHLASMADILLGSFRHCVNEPTKDTVNAAIFPTLMQVMWHREKDGVKKFLEYGLTLRPKTISVEAHAREYTDLRKRLRGYMQETK
jgi:hypothetical protein